jgi:hypothetical protein
MSRPDSRSKKIDSAMPPSSAAAEQPSAASGPKAPPGGAGGSLGMAARLWASAYRVELTLFAVSFLVLASFSSQRFLRQSEAPHFVYQAKAWLDGRLDLDPRVLPNLEDWACVREVDGQKVRCEGPVRSTDRWYVSFPAFPAAVMMPFVAVNGYQLNDTSLTVLAAALALAAFYSLLRMLSGAGETARQPWENVLLTALLGFGTVMFYCSIRGEVWFTAEVMGVAFSCWYLRNSVGARRPVLAGVFYSMAVLTRTPLLFTGIFFVMEAVCPGPDRMAQLRAFRQQWQEPLRKLGLFAAGAAPLALTAAVLNVVRFGAMGEFGHRFLYNNRVNADIDRYGLFSLEYLPRNLDAALIKLPTIHLDPLRLEYSPFGLSLLLTLPVLVLAMVPKEKRRLQWPLWAAVALCALPGLAYQNTGYMQFGFRFSLDWTPYVIVLLALSGWSLKARLSSALMALGFLVNFWGAVAFRGYTELVRRW